MRVLSLFSGIGLLDLGLAWAGFTTVGLCEIEPYCREVLAKHWPGVPIWSDVREVTWDAVRERCGAVDLVAGGFPCQPVSVAGARKGHADDRWLWPEMLLVVRDVRPRWVLAENVPGLRTLGADTVLADLDAAGYSAWPLVVGADDVGAPHRRKRVWIVARLRLADSYGAGELDASEPGRIKRTSRTAPSDACRRGPTVGDRICTGLEIGLGEQEDARQEQQAAQRAGDPTLLRGWPVRPGEQQHEWEAPRLVVADGARAGRADELLARYAVPCDAPGRWHVGDHCSTREAALAWIAESGMGGAADGSPRRLAGRNRRAALKALGNGVVPQVVAEVGRSIMAAEGLCSSSR